MSKNSRGWLKSVGRNRKVDVRDSIPKFLIVNEGKKTEPLYFEAFRVPGLDLKVVPAGRVHISVVKMAVELMEKANYTEVWCVFDLDKDVNNKQNTQRFNEALGLAEKHGIQVAYSNDAFELWYLLHFVYLKSAISRNDYIQKLNRYLPDPYEKCDENMYEKLEPNLDSAIKRAKKLHSSYDKDSPAINDPSTTVYKLVERLRQYSR